MTLYKGGSMQEYKCFIQKYGEEEQLKLTRENLCELYDKTSDIELKKALSEFLVKYK